VASVRAWLAKSRWGIIILPVSAVSIAVGFPIAQAHGFLWEGIVAAITLAVSGSLLAALLDLRNEASAVEAHEAPEPDSLERKIGLLLDSMRQSATLVEQVSAELDARALAVRRLQEDANQARVLAEMNKEQAQAVQRIIQSGMGSQLSATRREIFRDSVRLAVISFFAGGLITLLVTLLVHPLH
jgi:hypothetical protein